MWRISIYNVIPIALQCIVMFIAGFVFSIFPDIVQERQLSGLDSPGRFGAWLNRHNPFRDLEERFMRSGAYVVFLQAMGLVFMLTSGILSGILIATFIVHM